MRLKINVLALIVLAAGSLMLLAKTSIADTTTQPSAASMGVYKGTFNGGMATVELKDDQVALITSMMPDPADKTKMTESKSEGKWTLEDQTVTIVMMTMNGQPVSDDDAHRKIKLSVDEHGDKLEGNDKMPADLKRQAS